MTDRLVWIDCEMTGLDLGADALIEVAALVTDFDLNVLGEGVDIVIKPSQESLDQMVEPVGDWSGLNPAIGRTPNDSGMLTKGPLVTDLNAMLGDDAIAFRQRMVERAGALTREGGLLVTVTPPGPEAAYLVIDARTNVMEAGWRDAAGWRAERTAGAELSLPPAVVALRAAP